MTGLEVFAYVFGSLALGAGTGLVILALLKLETQEDKGRVSEGWRKSEIQTNVQNSSGGGQWSRSRYTPGNGA